MAKAEVNEDQEKDEVRDASEEELYSERCEEGFKTAQRQEESWKEEVGDEEC